MPPELPPIERIRHVYLIAVAGTGMGTLACMLADRGFRVTGSDLDTYPPMSEQLAAADIPVRKGFAAEHVVAERPDLVIIGNAVRAENPEARAVVEALPLGEAGARPPGPLVSGSARIPDLRSLDPSRGRRRERVRSVKTRAIEFGTEEIDVSLLYQLTDPAQAQMIGDALLGLSRGSRDPQRSVPELLDAIDARIEADGFEAVCSRGFGDRARARRFEIAAALNRLRSLRMRPE